MKNQPEREEACFGILYGANDYGQGPNKIETIDIQVLRVKGQLNRIEDAYQKNKHLMRVYDQNPSLFFATILRYVEELLPVIYTPTIAQSVQRFSEDYVSPHGAVFLDAKAPDKIERALKKAGEDLDSVDLVVVTDGEGVLGIGDWGINSVMIAIGKSAVYTVAAGIPPRNVLSVVIDNGTNREALRDSPLYLGNPIPRQSGAEYDAFIDQFVMACKKIFPSALLHWEDFGRENAREILERYRDDLATFNDDIQGTGVMMVAALHAISQVKQTDLTQEKIVIFGAGTAGVGIAEQIQIEMQSQGLSLEEATKRIYLVDVQGLVCEGQSNLTKDQQRFARKKSEGLAGLQDLLSIIQEIHPSVLIGTSGQSGAFSEEVVKEMARYQSRPAILPISNPTELQEARAEDIIRWTEGRGLVVTGSPTKPFEYAGINFQIGQANNALLYPGLGLGLIVSKANRVTDRMLSAAARGLLGTQDLSTKGVGLLPDVQKVRVISRKVAYEVIRAAQDEGVATRELSNIEAAIEEYMWEV